ncbi:TonB-dependent receptor [Hyphomicrobium sp. D-2]|uniref:TonB-dependent receptor domain-containing protein n=1 Tax=Hyphomicrobium sp. D-2 TaxID=3041621 RepID=UPI0024571FAC|nr:TonB-dependent receptor [Hyphomicrobium sp. D-2]MDH4981708.1 TonB-dependent receptor [Hyphomicrobium sp. D-2]
MTTTAMMGLMPVVVAPHSSYAQSSTVDGNARNFNIPAQPLASALNAFGRQSGFQVTSAAAAVRGVTSRSVSGTFTPQDALSQLLEGTGISFTFNGDGTVLIGGQVSTGNDGASVDGAIALDTIDVSGGAEGGSSGDAPYETAAPVSTTTAENLQVRYGGDVNQAMRNTPGTFTRQGGSQPAYSVNIRGMSGYGRVNSLIDGVPQTFRNAAGHGAYGGTYLYMHPEFISGIDVTRGVVAGAHGSGTLSGAANFSSLGVNDVLAPGEDLGGLTRWKVGSNGWNWSGLAAAGARHTSEDGGEISFITAWAMTETENYRNGDGDFMRVNVDGARAPAQNSPGSRLAKLQIKPNDTHNFNFGYLKYENEFTNSYYDWLIDNNTYYMNYALTPGNNLVDARVNLYYNQTNLLYEPNSTSSSYRGRTTEALGWGGDFSNTSRFALSDELGLKLFYGASYNMDDYSVTYRGANAPGTLEKASGFADGTLSWGMFDFIGGLRYDRYDLAGIRQERTQGTGGGWLEECPAGPTNCPAEDVEKTGSQWNPKGTIAAKPFDWLQLYGTYAHTFRPPTAQEAFWGLVPFYDDVGSGIFNNLGLLPESSKGWDIGANFTWNNVLRRDDRFRMKVGYFRNHIENYITNDLVDIDRRAGTGVLYQTSAVWVNVPGITTMSGIEIEGGYDAGIAYANFSFTASETNLPHGWGMGSDIGNGDIDMLPDNYGMLDLGVRLLDRKLTLGGKVRYTGGSSFRRVIDGEYYDVPAYALLDLYGTYSFSNYSKVFFSVENLTNKLYGLALSGDGLSTDYTRVNPTGRGLTFIAGFETKLGHPLDISGAGSIWEAFSNSRGAAADTYDWSGAYTGLSIGHNWSNTAADFSFTQPRPLSSSINSSIETLKGGFFAGYNQQFQNNLVVGMEADVNVGAFGGGGPDRFYSYYYNASNYLRGMITTHQDFSAGLRARAGLAFGRYLPYVTAGITVSRYSHEEITRFEKGQYTSATPVPFGGGKDVLVGMTFGGGLEHALTDHVTFRTEYRYSDIDSLKSFSSNGVEYDIETGPSHDLGFGVSYKF